jgi:cytochrome c oxidase subunit 3
MPAVCLGVSFFVASECIFFAALFAGWFTARSRSPQWPPIGIHVDPTLGAIVSALLILSSVVVYFAGAAIRRGDVGLMKRMLWLAVILAAVALAGQSLDLSDLTFSIHTDGFGTIYWMTSIIDSVHVAGAMIFAFVILTRARMKLVLPSNHDLLKAGTIFWHFVVGVSIFTFLVLEVVT